MVKVGDVYKSKATGPRGWHAGTRFWLVMAVHENSVVMLGLNKDGDIVSSTRYGLWTVECRELVARVKGVQEFAKYLKGETDGYAAPD